MRSRRMKWLGWDSVKIHPKEREWEGVGFNSSGWRWGLVVDFFECGNKTSCFIKWGGRSGISWLSSTYFLLKKDSGACR